MINCNPQNERIKRDYVEFLRQADKKSEATVRGVEKSILRFEQHTGFTDFKCFGKAQAISFRAALAKPETKDKPLSPATIHSTLTALQRFLRYLACQPGMKSKIKVTDIEYLNLSDKEVRAATSAPSKPFPTLEQLRHTLATMPAGTEIECRDRALFALLMMTGIRDNAAASLRIRHVDLDRMLIIQDPTTVRTKNSKLIESVLLPLGQDVERAFLDWVAYIRTGLLYGADDPVFPQTASRIDPVRGPLSDGLKPGLLVQFFANSDYLSACVCGGRLALLQSSPGALQHRRSCLPLVQDARRIQSVQPEFGALECRYNSLELRHHFAHEAAGIDPKCWKSRG